MIKNFKNIKCKECQAECKTGKRNLCDICYGKYLIDKQKNNQKTNPKKTKDDLDIESLKGNIQYPKKKVKSEKELQEIKKQKDLKKKEKLKAKREEKKLSKSEILILVQKLARLVGSNRCCTCNKTFTGTVRVNGGHGVRASKGMSTAFLLRNIHEQCSHCNNIGQGEQFLYAKFVDKKYGDGTFEYLYKLSNIQYKFSKPDLQELRKKTEEFIARAEKLSTFQEKDNLRYEFMNWQESTSWYNEIIQQLS